MTMKIDTQMNARLLFLIGTIVWFTNAIGHPVLVGIDLYCSPFVKADLSWYNIQSQLAFMTSGI